MTVPVKAKTRLQGAMADIESRIREPRLLALYEYWDSKRTGRRMPARHDLDPTDVPNLLPILFIWDVDIERDTFVCRLCGTAVVELVGKDFTGQSFEEMHGGRYQPMKREHQSVLATGEPHLVVRTAGWLNKAHKTYERLLLPLSDDGRSVNMLLGGICVTATADTSAEPQRWRRAAN